MKFWAKMFPRAVVSKVSTTMSRKIGSVEKNFDNNGDKICSRRFKIKPPLPLLPEKSLISKTLEMLAVEDYKDSDNKDLVENTICDEIRTECNTARDKNEG